LIHLTRFPIFADETIYIRWAQLIVDDWWQYLFFPLNDGKTPLFIWLLVPGQWSGGDPVWWARSMAVLGGVAGAWGIWFVLRELGASTLAQRLGLLFSFFLPFWFTYHHLSLMDGWLVAWLAWMVYFALVTIRLLPTKKFTEWRRWPWRSMLGLGVCYGVAILTKLPGILFVIPIGWLALCTVPPKRWIPAGVALGSSLLLGLVMFATFKLHPAFGQLFGRSSDFLYPVGEILSGGWLQTMFHVPRLLGIAAWYVTWPVVVFALVGLFQPKWRTQQFWLWLSALSWIALFGVFGKTVYPRYLLPTAVFFTISGSLSLAQIVEFVRDTKGATFQRILAAATTAILLANMTQASVAFAYGLVWQAEATPFVAYDREQYLTEWSSGHGIPETVAWMHQTLADHSLAVATEGSFGTLPDGLLLAMHQQDVSNLYIEGIGQPVRGIPHNFAKRAATFDQTILVVNSHRMALSPSANAQLLFEVCRPFDSPCLQVYDITAETKRVAEADHTP
jgi:4-amino-4-deoxy-L-arabinose transferase-like glycosyltransferase